MYERDLGFWEGATGNSATSKHYIPLSQTPVYCSTLASEAALFEAGRRSIAASPQLCPAVKALPEGWVIDGRGNSEPPYEFVEAAMKEWVAATDGGPITQAYFTDDMSKMVPSTEARDSSVSNRYDMVLQSIIAATDWLC